MDAIELSNNKENGYIPLVVVARANFDGGPDTVLMERRMRTDGTIYTHRPNGAESHDISAP